MFKTRNDRLTIASGDSATLQVSVLAEDGTAYALTDGESINFIVRKTKDSDSLITKTISTLTSGVGTVALAISDTANMAAGFYVYGFALVGTDKKDSFEPVGDFIVIKGVA